jgi:hypothetical protein
VEEKPKVPLLASEVNSLLSFQYGALGMQRITRRLFLYYWEKKNIKHLLLNKHSGFAYSHTSLFTRWIKGKSNVG